MEPPSYADKCDKIDNVCKAKLDDAVMFLQHNPDTLIYLVANTPNGQSVATHMRSYLLGAGISRYRVYQSTETPTSGLVQFTAR